MSSISTITPQVTLSDLRGTQAADKLKNVEATKAKIEKSAKDFESVLMGHWLEQAQQSFASVPGGDANDEPSLGKDQFQSIAMQAVASALSGRNGGLGIAHMVAKHLEAAKIKPEVDPNAPLKIKNLHPSANPGIPLKTEVKK
jgi:Rod binding domain-containing protein